MKKRNLFFACVLVLISSSASASWTSIGPWGGEITSLATVSASPNIMYAGTEGSGVYKSTDSGATWSRVNTGFSSSAAVIRISSVATHPTDTTTVYAAMSGYGVYKSTNGGASWVEANTWLDDLYVTALAIDPNNPVTVIAGTYSNGIFRSTNGGSTWSNRLLYKEISALAVHSTVMYAGAWYSGVYKSTDGGVNWSAKNTGLPSTVDTNISSLAIDPITPTTVYAGTDGGICKTTDGATSWTVVNAGLTNVTALAIDPADTNTIFAGTKTGQMYKSSDAGANWSVIDTSPSTSKVEALIAKPTTSPTTMYAGTFDGVYKSEDGGTNWTAINSSISVYHVNVLATDIAHPGTVYAGTEGHGMFKSADYGATWAAVNAGIANNINDRTVNDIVIDPSSSTVYIGTEGAAYKSTDGGQNWSALGSGLPSGVEALTIDPATNTLYAGITWQGVYKLPGGESTWTAVNNTSLTGVLINALAFSSGSPGTLYAGTNGSGIYKSTDGGANWSNYSSSTLASVLSLAVDPLTPSTIYAASTYYAPEKTTNSGATWSTIGTGLPGTQGVDCFAINPIVPNIIYTGLVGGVYKSINSGANWAALNPGLPSIWINAMAIDPGDVNTVYAGSYGFGVWKISFIKPIIVVTDEVTPINDLQIPFGSVTQGSTSDKTVTITNRGNANLIFPADPYSWNTLTVPFSIQADTCAGTTIAPSGTCAITVRFAPTAVQAFSDTFSISSNDTDMSLVTVSVSGTGLTAPTPNIQVSDSVAPNNDNQIPFGKLTEGNTADKTVTITNSGTADLIITAVASANTLTAPFSKAADNCSGQTIAPSGTCTITVRFAPAATSIFNDSFDIPSNDPDTPTVTITVSGTGVSATGNNPPDAPLLVFPANGQTGLGATVTFKWKKSSDPDGDTVTYQLYYSTDSSFTGCSPVTVASAGVKTIAYAGMEWMGLVLIGMIAAAGFKRRKAFVVMLIVILASGGLLVACGGGGGSDDNTPGPTPSDEVSYTSSVLDTGKTYYWKVVANDGKGGTAPSAVWNFTTQ